MPETIEKESFSLKNLLYVLVFLTIGLLIALGLLKLLPDRSKRFSSPSQKILIVQSALQDEPIDLAEKFPNANKRREPPPRPEVDTTQFIDRTKPPELRSRPPVQTPVLLPDYSRNVPNEHKERPPVKRTLISLRSGSLDLRPAPRSAGRFFYGLFAPCNYA